MQFGEKLLHLHSSVALYICIYIVLSLYTLTTKICGYEFYGFSQQVQNYFYVAYAED